MSFLKDIILSNADKVAEPSENTDDVVADVVKPEGEKPEAEPTEETKQEPVIDDTKVAVPVADVVEDKKGTAQYKIQQLVKQKKETQELLAKEVAEKQSLIARLEALELASKKTDNNHVDYSSSDDAKYLTEERLATIMTDMFANIEKTQKTNAAREKANTSMDEFGALLEKEYGKFFDKDLELIDEKAQVELELISELYKSNPDKWLEYTKKNGVTALSKLVRGGTASVLDVEEKQNRVDTIDTTGTKPNIDIAEKPKSLKSAIAKAVAILKEG